MQLLSWPEWTYGPINYFNGAQRGASHALLSIINVSKSTWHHHRALDQCGAEDDRRGRFRQEYANRLSSGSTFLILHHRELGPSFFFFFSLRNFSASPPAHVISASRLAQMTSGIRRLTRRAHHWNRIGETGMSRLLQLIPCCQVMKYIRLRNCGEEWENGRGVRNADKTHRGRREDGESDGVLQSSRGSEMDSTYFKTAGVKVVTRLDAETL